MQLMGKTWQWASIIAILGSPAVSEQSTYEDYVGALSSLLMEEVPSYPRAIPNAATVGVPSGFSLPGGSAVASMAVSDTRERIYGKGADGSGAIGAGFGEAGSPFGFEATVGISSVHPSDFGDSGSVNLKASWTVPSGSDRFLTSFGFGITRALTWGDMNGEDAGFYLVGSSTSSIRLGAFSFPSMSTIGYGTGIGTSDREDGLIAGVGISLTDWLTVGTSWYGDELLFGASTLYQISNDKFIQLGVNYSDALKENSGGRIVIHVSLLAQNFFASRR